MFKDDLKLEKNIKKNYNNLNSEYGRDDYILMAHKKRNEYCKQTDCQFRSYQANDFLL